MPRIRRWFHVSHDINSDPEVWELTEKFGDRGLRAWLEILSIADRNDGLIPMTQQQLVKAFTIKLNTVQTKTTRLLCWFEDKTWLLRDPVLRVRNYAEYNPSRDAKKSQTVSPPNPPNPPNQPKEEDNTSHLDKPNEAIKWPHPELLIKLYNEKTCDDYPAVIKVTSGRMKKARQYLKEFPDLEFWERVMDEMNKSAFLRGIIKNNGHESFQANFDWLLTRGKDGTENAVKVFERKYQHGA